MIPLPNETQLALIRRWSAAKAKLIDLEERIVSMARTTPSSVYYWDTLTDWWETKHLIDECEETMRAIGMAGSSNRMKGEVPNADLS